MVVSKFVLPLQPQTRKNGSLDEWLSQRSAKPCTAVRIRQEPQRNLRTPFVNSGFEGFSFFEGAEIGAECQECFCFLLTIIGKNNNAS